MGVSEDDLHGMFNQISFVGLVALDEMLNVGGERGESTTLGETIPDKGEGPVAAFEVEEMKQILADSINRMPEREKIVLTLYYYEGLTLGEIGEVLGPAATAATAAAGADAGYRPPVDASVVDPFRPPPQPWAAGNRGLDYATRPGQEVRAAADGEVVFAGAVADSLHVVLLHPDG